MTDIQKLIVYILVTIATGVVQYVTSRSAKPQDAETEKGREQCKLMRNWGLIALIGSILMAPLYYLLQTKAYIVVIIYGVFLVVNGFVLQSRIGKNERKYKMLADQAAKQAKTEPTESEDHKE